MTNDLPAGRPTTPGFPRSLVFPSFSGVPSDVDPFVPTSFNPYQYRFSFDSATVQIGATSPVRAHLAACVAVGIDSGAVRFAPGSTERVRLDVHPDWLAAWHRAPGFKFFRPPRQIALETDRTTRARLIFPGWVVDWCRGMTLIAGGNMHDWLRAAVLSRGAPPTPGAPGAKTSAWVDARVVAAVRLLCPVGVPVEAWVASLPRSNRRAPDWPRRAKVALSWRRGPAGGLGWGVADAQDVESRVIAALEARGTTLEDIDPMAAASRRLLHSTSDGREP